MDVNIPQDTETEGEKQFKRLLDKQLKKNITLHELTQQQRTFKKSSVYKPLTEDVVGEVDLEKFKKIEEEKSYVEKLQQSGLNQYEINQWIKQQNHQENGGSKNVNTNPQILQNQMEEIKKKIDARNEEIDKTVQTRDVLCLSRHEMEIESSLKRTNKRTQFLHQLVKVANHSTDHLHPDDPRNHLKEMEKELLDNFKAKKRKKEIDAIATCARRPITDDEIRNNRLTCDEIKSLPKFTNYSCGEINQVLYIKNLSRQTIEDDLIEVFGRFGTVQVRILTGKMHGQAFVTFLDGKIAEKALEKVNGFILHGKPLIIYYKKS